jgi:hypothetical protein
MELIDWLFAARNALWILGLSIALAAWSYTSWWAAGRRERMRRALGLPLFQVPFSVGLTLFSASLAWGATRWWERGLWILLGLAFVWQTVVHWRWAVARGWDAPPEERGVEDASTIAQQGSGGVEDASTIAQQGSGKVEEQRDG